MSIFLTGAAGFLGGKLLRNLLSETKHHLYILVRDIDKAKRLIDTFPPNEKNRIHLLKGDITQPFCGLTEYEIESLTGKIHIFYHLAALVKFDLDLYEEIFAVNYDGTYNALELANSMNTEKFFYVSTAYTVGKMQYGIEELYSPDCEYHNPYEESKVKSEHLAFSYANEMDISIFRPSIIVGDSETGEADSKFTLYGFMRALDIFKRRVMRNEDSMQKTYYVAGNKEGTSNFVPVNYVADILSLAVSKAEANTIYNIINPEPASNFEIMSMIKKALQFDQLFITQSQELHELSDDELKLNEMIQVFNPYLKSNIVFEDANTQKLIKDSKINHLQLESNTLQMIIDAYFGIQQEEIENVPQS
ncbi:SDR family oxidoreductase [Lederbergia citrea]|uniref:SDR family oxidoreductase n=1 Tax=Lederbergia citrea TaxID=2833581 RepID=A0A942UT25_9BACI|nr:SDR family oxidoreductase [Lederbergia citrea]MBS4179344.1 SDR family oxidoreductase [Lederbergia citrea]MBS4206013.1 SDR family oxidoreductase [Lederbergia citrea]MBS4224538.1 SDR family oxidoreductase [Lederbergia citrea]